jgi:1-acyl-sn-glycerol-3-phosphate acyltransferase
MADATPDPEVGAPPAEQAIAADEQASATEAAATAATDAERAAAEAAARVEPGAGADEAGPGAPAGAGTARADAKAEAKAARAQAKADAIRARGVDVHPPTALERRAYAAVRAAFLGLSRLYLRLEVHGADKLPDAPFVVAPVHRSNIDFLLAATITKPRMRYMGKASIWKSRALGAWVSMLGAFPVHRGTADRESLRTCLKVLGQGESLVMFPEGTRQSGPRVEPLFDGTAYVAARAGVPLVPLGIGGTEEVMPPGSAFVKPRKVVLVVGDPIHPPAGAAGRAPRRVVRELTEELHGAIQAAFDEASERAH